MELLGSYQGAIMDILWNYQGAIMELSGNHQGTIELVASRFGTDWARQRFLFA